MREFERMFTPDDRTRIVDVGGAAYNWGLIEAHPHVVMVNVDARPGTNGKLVAERGDGRHLQYADGTFEIAYSNSVIEHVGGPDDRRAFAEEIRRVARRYYVQTPYRWFFVEPHLIAIGIHLLPRALTRRLVRWSSVWGFVERPDQTRVDGMLDSIHLLDRKEFRALFPDAEILEEKWFGLTKSLIAVRR